MSGHAALQAGAVTADVYDSSSVWYNPAGLARAQGKRFDANFSAYALRVGGVPQLDPVGEDAERDTISVLNFAAVPAGLASLAQFSFGTMGFGVFVPQMQITGLRTRVVQPRTDSQSAIEFDVDNYKTTQEMYGGPALGIHVAPGVDIGVSLLAYYRAIVSTENARILIRDDEQTLVATGQRLDDWMQLGIAPQLGVQLQVTRRLRYGMMLRLPSVRILQVLGASETTTFVLGGETTTSAAYRDELRFDTRFLRPLRMQAGVSYDLEEVHLAMDVNYQPPFQNAEVEESLKTLVNARVGARHTFANDTTLGGGLFTNRSATKELRDLGDERIDFYGFTLAAQFGTPYRVSERGKEVLSPDKRMRFGSSFAFSYAVGIGQTLHGRVGGASLEQLYVPEPYDVVAHEWIVSFGSSLFEE